MTITEDLLNITETMGSSVEHTLTYQDAYNLLLRSLIEIRQLTYRIAVLESKVLNQ